MLNFACKKFLFHLAVRSDTMVVQFLIFRPPLSMMKNDHLLLAIQILLCSSQSLFFVLFFLELQNFFKALSLLAELG